MARTSSKHPESSLQEPQNRVGRLASLEQAIPQRQREEDRQTQQPHGIHGRDARAVGRQQVTQPGVQEQMEHVEEQRRPPEDSHRL